MQYCVIRASMSSPELCHLPAMLRGQLSQPHCLGFLIYKMGTDVQTSQDVARIE